MVHLWKDFAPTPPPAEYFSFCAPKIANISWLLVPAQQFSALNSHGHKRKSSQPQDATPDTVQKHIFSCMEMWLLFLWVEASWHLHVFTGLIQVDKK